jgi:hypothetical protein
LIYHPRESILIDAPRMACQSLTEFDSTFAAFSRRSSRARRGWIDRNQGGVPSAALVGVA